MRVTLSILKFHMNQTFGDIFSANTIHKLVLEHISIEYKFQLNDESCIAMNYLYDTTSLQYYIQTLSLNFFLTFNLSTYKLECL